MSALMIIIFCVLIVIRLPIALALGASTAIVLVVTNGLPMSGIIQRLVLGADSFLLLAIPLFVLTGRLMNVGGVTTRIFNFARSLVGHIPGALGHANVVASMIFAGMSGSAIADAGGLGQIEMKAMTEAGYPKKFSAAITAASSTIGPIIPPSIPMVIYASMAGVSVGELFLGGFLPGILMGLSLMLMVYFISVKHNYPKDIRATLPQILISFKKAFFPLLTPVIIIGGILLGIFTPTEASAIAAVYSAILGIFVYKEIKWKDIPKIIIETMITTSMIMFIISMASSFSWILTIDKIGDTFQQMIFSITANKYLILLLINLLLLFLGSVMENNAVMILVLPVLIPLVQAIGIDLVHFGVIAVLNLMIGVVTPPVGVCLFVTSDVAGIKIEELMKSIIPFLIPLIISLLLTTYFPWFVKFLPNLLMR